MIDDRAPVNEIVRSWAESEPERLSLAVHGADGEVEQLTCRELAARAASMAHRFEALGLRPGDPIVLLAHSSSAFIASFLGAQEAGLLPVPCPPPDPLEGGRRVRERIREIIARTGARAIVLADTPLDAEATAALVVAGVSLVGETPRPLPDAAMRSRTMRRHPDGLAYCQFTSGSGGRAKGVLLDHANLAANIRSMAAGLSLTRQDVFVTWLPLFHDMGLVAYVLMPLALGCPAHILPTAVFIKRPASWLQLMSRAGGTLCAAPNFAYALCARRVSDDECVGLDLSRWRIASNGSEPVTSSAVTAFVDRFAACGFRAGAMLPCYGLAEATLCVTTRRPGEGAWFETLSQEQLVRDLAKPESSGSTVASAGRPLPDVEIAVRDSGGRPLPDRHVGEIVVRSPSVMRGYLASAESEGLSIADGWLATGDLGYTVEDELFVVGRKKDLIIRMGRNYYPAELEDAATTVPGVRAGRAVAFSVSAADSERVIIAVERASEDRAADEAVRTAVRSAVFSKVRFPPDEVVLLPRGALPLTTSGKVMRPEARRLYETGAWAEP